MIRRLFGIALSLSVLMQTALADPPSEFKDPNFDRAAERAKALAIVENPPVPQIVVENMSKATPEARAFLKFYKEVWAPMTMDYLKANIRWYVSYVSIDRALFNDEAEREQWNQNVIKYSDQRAEIISSEKFLRATKKLAALAEGLEGDAPDLARKYWEYLTKFNYRPEDQELVARLAEIDNQIKEAQNNSPFAASAFANRRKAQEIEAAYYDGQLELTEAARQLEELGKDGSLAMGHDIANKIGPLVNEKAIILTTLANNLGYETHAQFMFAQKQDFFAEGMKTPAERIASLERFLEHLKPVRLKLAKAIVANHPLRPDFDRLSSTELSLLFPESHTLVNDYFLMENVNSFWEDFYTENGFPMQRWKRLVLDSYRRDRKQPHAYMAPQGIRHPRRHVIDARDLNIDLPKTERGWMYPVISIVQNVSRNSVSDYETVGHETGHFWEFSSGRFESGAFTLLDNEGDPITATAWLETPSMAMEKVLLDPVLLKAKLKDANGQPVPEENVDQYVASSKINEMSGLIGTAMGAWFDYSLWDYAYTKDSKPFNQRMKELIEERDTRFSSNKKPRKRYFEPVNGYYITSHFLSGSVKYEYFYSEMAAQQVHHALLDRLEAETGRRTYLNQPTMGKHLTEDFYPDGHKMQFPKSIERFTNVPYDPDQVLKNIGQTVNELVQYLEDTKPAKVCPGVFLTYPASAE